MPVNVAQCAYGGQLVEIQSTVQALGQAPLLTEPFSGPIALSFWFWGLSVFLTKTTGKPSFNYSMCECVPRGSRIGQRTACGVGLLLPLRWIQESNSSSQI